jgi:hypothetical protein
MIFAAPALAKDPGQESYMVRVMLCEGPDAKMEIYLPQSIALSPDAKVRAMERPVIGYYTLDLTAARKGKVHEPVRVGFSADKKTLIIDQYTRGLPPTGIPVAGGTVDFDKRFGTQAKCNAFNTQE